MKKKRQWITGYALVAPLVIGGLVFYVIPFVMVFYYSFRSRVGRNGKFVGLENYRELFENEIFKMACGNTLRFLIIVLPLIMVIAYAIALFLKTAAKKYKILKPILLLPFIMPVAGSVLLVENVNMTIETLYLWKNTGYSVILLLAGLMSISGEQYDCAALDGANAWQKFVYITMPQMRYSVFFAFLFSLINAFKSFRDIFLVGGQYPENDMYMLQHFMNNSFEKLNYGKLSTASVTMFVVVSVVVSGVYTWVHRKEGQT